MRGKVFTGGKKRDFSILRVLVPILVFVLIAVFVIVGVGNVSAAGSLERRKGMEQAVRRSVVQCYAIEGRYPKNLAYLAENYGLMLNEDQYVYHYERLGDNLMPDIFVFPVG
ncbi:MAG: hypothetical protein VB081_04165 [Christensenella sp.]|uniref:hypothetical protein n=1 Tax=Christensenella sp. TaxID=1935934 RepID=UPI002B1FE7C7|nr:hypothetical protein [Christensenella sp.]MEA5002674.1 hypothetical protein [Christensenella sp.]